MDGQAGATAPPDSTTWVSPSGSGAVLEVHEAGDGAPVLFLHGEDGTIHAGPLLEQLARQHRVVVPQHPGWGGSVRPAHVTTTRDVALVHLELLETLTERFGTPVTVVGCSFGGWVALEMAVMAPRTMAGLVLVSPTGIKVGDRETRDFVDLYALGIREQQHALYGSPDAAPALDDLTDEQWLYLAKAQEATARYCWAPYMHNPFLRPWLGRVGVPTTVVSGGADGFVLAPDYYGVLTRELGAGATLTCLDGVGHRVEEEAPELLAKLVGEVASTPLPNAALTAG